MILTEKSICQRHLAGLMLLFRQSIYVDAMAVWDTNLSYETTMKTMNTKLWIGLIGLATLSWSASATTYSDTDFGTMASANGTYVPGLPGYEHLSYVSTGPNDPINGADAVVGVRGPLGTLSSLNMSFQYSNPDATCPEEFEVEPELIVRESTCAAPVQAMRRRTPA